MPVISASKSAGSWRKSTEKKDETKEEEDYIPLLDIEELRRQNDSFQNVSLLPDVAFADGKMAGPLASSSRSADAFQMRSRGRRSDEDDRSDAAQSANPPLLSHLNPSFILVDIPIEQDDTLPSFAIKYHVTTAELKRINNMFHDQDFYGRQKLKVPIHKYGILAERYLPHLDASDSSGGPNDPQSGHILVDLSSHANSPTLASSSPASSMSDQDEVMMMTQNMPLRTMFSSQSRAATLFLQKMDRNLQRLAKEAQSRRPRSPDNEDELLNSRQRIQPLPLNDGLGCDTADCGINLKALLCMILCLTIVLPAAFLFYKLYCLHHPDFCPDPTADQSGNANHSAAAVFEYHQNGH